MQRLLATLADVAVLLAQQEFLQRAGQLGSLVVDGEQVDGLGADARIVIGEQGAGKRLADVGVGGKRLQPLERLQADAGIGVVLESIDQGEPDIVVGGLAGEQLDRFDAQSRVGWIADGGEQQPADPLVVQTAGEDALAGFVNHHLHLAGGCGLDVADARRARIEDPGGLQSGKAAGGHDARAEEAERHERHRAGRLGERWNREPAPEERQDSGARPRLAIQRGGQPQTGVAQFEGRRLKLLAVEQAVHGALAVEHCPAVEARFEVRFQQLFLVHLQLAVEHQSKLLANVFAGHIHSPNAERIFCVALKRQFLAASSLVPSTSPMARRRMPW